MGGTDREFVLFVPSGYDGFQPHALMLIFHVWSMAPSLSSLCERIGMTSRFSARPSPEESEPECGRLGASEPV